MNGIGMCSSIKPPSLHVKTVAQQNNNNIYSRHLHHTIDDNNKKASVVAFC